MAPHISPPETKALRGERVFNVLLLKFEKSNDHQMPDSWLETSIGNILRVGESRTMPLFVSQEGQLPGVVYASQINFWLLCQCPQGILEIARRYMPGT